jgi:hypothetical protein
VTIERQDLAGKFLVYDTIVLSSGDRVAECVDTDGTVAYWLLRPVRSAHEADAVHGSVHGALHERLGPLPDDFQDRVRGVPLRCGRRTQGGRGCRSKVSDVGQVCHLHGPAKLVDGQ